MSEEQQIEIREGLTKGLRADSKNPRNTEAFTSFSNVIPTEWGAKTFTRFADHGTPLIGSGETANPLAWVYPYPQLFVGKRAIVLHGITGASLEVLFKPTYTTGGGWAANIIGTDEIDVKKVSDGTTSWTIPSESTPDDAFYHFVDMYDAWALVRPNSTIFEGRMRATTLGLDDPVLGQGTADTPHVVMRTATSHRGRVIAGGFDSSNFWSDNFKYMWRAWAHQVGHSFDFDFNDIDGGYVMWSSIGGGDLMFMFDTTTSYAQQLPQTSEEQTTPAEPILFHGLGSNEAGFMPMPWKGNVQIVKGLGEAVVVYGENGISALTPSQTPGYAGYGLKEIWNHTGVYGRGAVGGNESIHIFLDTYGTLWAMGPDLQPKKVGYKEFFNGLTAPIIAYDEEESYAYIGDDTRAYCLSRTGLSSLNQKIRSVTQADTDKIAVFDNIAFTGSEESSVFETDVHDMGTRRIKVITGVSIGGSYGSTPTIDIIIKYRHMHHGAYTSSTAVQSSSDGFCPFNVSGVDFKISIDVADYDDVESIDYFLIHYKLADGRQPRSVYDAQIARR